jgi:hypothetical protein
MIELHITYDEATGNVNVNGPVHNKGLCYLMLECAKDAIRDHCDQAQKLPPNSGLEPFIRKRTEKPKR